LQIGSSVKEEIGRDLFLLLCCEEDDLERTSSFLCLFFSFPVGLF
jgi:hypothetical protein